MAKNICVIPFYDSQTQNKLFNPLETINRDNAAEPYIKLKEFLQNKGFNVGTYDIVKPEESEYLIFLGLKISVIVNSFLHDKFKNSCYMALEPPVVQRLHTIKNLKVISKIFGRILTIYDDIIDDKKFVKIFYPIPAPEETNIIPFHLRKFVTTISSYKTSNKKDELYSERIKAINYFGKAVGKDFDFYGFGWKQEEFPRWKGVVDKKIDTLKKYKFAICYENQIGVKGLLSEKLFDCLYAGTIPIYLGALNISEYVPEECFIDKRNFSSYDELLAYLRNISEEDFSTRILYIKNFLESEQFQKYLPSTFSKTVYNSICEKNSDYNYLLAACGILYLIIFKIFLKINYFAIKKYY